MGKISRVRPSVSSLSFEPAVSLTLISASTGHDNSSPGIENQGRDQNKGLELEFGLAITVRQSV